MEIHQIEAFLKSPNSQERLKAITELRQYDSEVAIPLLMTKLKDPEFLVRSFVAMGLGRKQNAQSFAALLEMMNFDKDPNVRAEASNSVSMYGEKSLSHLVQKFHQDEHWLVRRSILAAVSEMHSPEELFDICVCALAGEDLTVREAGIDALVLLAGSGKEAEALQQLLPLKNESWWRIRARVARALKQFNDPKVKAVLSDLMKDEDHRVVAAALESSLPD
ncbi:MAG: HEAT repeat domain-containing protein [Symploca sp. SIO1C4]|uniref:HEAT repeat domain-containing protein n=1 Tax=Symploca sp. SIO1C4 TaxID=2607765 RepID=A0A6B3NFE8_9CYAN|nr:HEAT repeat domain-containing protein [Symploca sp. SIO1C4]